VRIPATEHLLQTNFEASQVPPTHLKINMTRTMHLITVKQVLQDMHTHPSNAHNDWQKLL
jgi:hypothetical protein